jgi:glycosyltransferase involved in cell wall biosynthesis
MVDVRVTRIAILTARPTAHGPLPKLVSLLTDALRRRGCAVETLPWGRRTEDESKFAKALSRPRDIIEARRAVKRGRFPIVVVNTAHDWSTLVRDIVLVRVLASRDRVIIVHFHGSQSSRLVAPGSVLFKRATAALIRSVDGAFVLSVEEQSEWQRFSPTSRVLVVRNPRPALPQARPLEGDGRPMILFVSRLMAEKGVLDLVRAIALVNHQTPCRLVLAGDGPDATRVRDLVADLSVGSSVELTGHVNEDELARLYAAADIFALPTSWAEGFPTVILEAMAAGLPIVTTKWRGPADHLAEGEHALFVPPNDPCALAASLLRLLSDPDLGRRMAAANREKVREFDPDAVAANYLAAVERIVAARTSEQSRVA